MALSAHQQVERSGSQNGDMYMTFPVNATRMPLRVCGTRNVHAAVYISRHVRGEHMGIQGPVSLFEVFKPAAEVGDVFVFLGLCHPSLCYEPQAAITALQIDCADSQWRRDFGHEVAKLLDLHDVTVLLSKATEDGSLLCG